MIKRLSIGLMLIMALYFSFFDTYPYEEKIQRLYDKNNPSGNKACIPIPSIIWRANFSLFHPKLKKHILIV